MSDDEDIWQAFDRVQKEHAAESDKIRSMPEPLYHAVFLILQAACCFMAYKYDDSEPDFQKGIRNINTAAELLKTYGYKGCCGHGE